MDILVGDDFLFIIALRYSVFSCLSESVFLWAPQAALGRLVGTPQVLMRIEGEKGLDALSGWHWLTKHTSLGSSLVFTLLFSNFSRGGRWVPLQLAFLPSCIKRDVEYVGEEWGRWLVRLRLAEMLSLHYQPLMEPYRTLLKSITLSHRLVNSVLWIAAIKGCICLNTMEGDSEHNTLEQLFTMS